MKILLVSISNHHFFQWANQLELAGHDVYWFDILDGGPKSEKLSWMTQIKGWKMRWDYPFRQSIKAKSPSIYEVIQTLNERKTAVVFEEQLISLQPDIVHCFEMQLAGFPILSVMQKHSTIKLVYSTWGSDIFYFKAHSIKTAQVKNFLDRVNFLITDCYRDYHIAQSIGYQNTFLGVFPGNGGIAYPLEDIQPIEERPLILIKGYESFGCKASTIIAAMQLLPNTLFENFEVVIYSCDAVIIDQIKASVFFSRVKHRIIPRTTFVDNTEILKMMGSAALHISNNISDGMPNTLLESMGMGAFPIQSNPGGASAEVLSHGSNGYLIKDPLDEKEIANWIEKAIEDIGLRTAAQEFNIKYARECYDRKSLQPKVCQLYQDIQQ